VFTDNRDCGATAASLATRQYNDILRRCCEGASDAAATDIADILRRFNSDPVLKSLNSPKHNTYCRPTPALTAVMRETAGVATPMDNVLLSESTQRVPNPSHGRTSARSKPK
jgi:hypothetical protein